MQPVLPCGCRRDLRLLCPVGKALVEASREAYFAALRDPRHQPEYQHRWQAVLDHLAAEPEPELTQRELAYLRFHRWLFQRGAYADDGGEQP